MIVKETVNEQDISSILRHPAIYETTADDTCQAVNEFKIPFEGYRYIGGYVNSEIMALMVYHAYRDGNECHVHVLPEYRKEYALNFGEQSLLYRGTQQLYAEIPSNCKNVLDFAINFDFKVIGIADDKFIKDGVSYDMNILRLEDVTSKENSR